MSLNHHWYFILYLLFASSLTACGGARSSTSSSVAANTVVKNIQSTLTSSGDVIISWDVVVGLTYKVYVSTDDAQSYGLLSENLTVSEYIDKNVPLNIPLRYNVTANGQGQRESELLLATTAVINVSKANTISSSEHNCVIKKNGSLWCWGNNDHGQLGYGQATHSEAAVQEKSLAVDWSQVAVGFNHTCAIKINGDMYCWGDIPPSSVIQSSSVIDLTIPNIVVGSDKWLKVDLGKNTSCAINNETKLFCWGGTRRRPGSGIVGPITLNNTVNVNLTVLGIYSQTPAVVVNLKTNIELAGWSDISVGQNHICAIQVVNSKSKMRCWGNRLSGQLGDDNQADTTTVSIPVLSLDGTKGLDWHQVYVGYNYSCAIKRDKSLWCWGANNDSQLGLAGLDKRDQHLPKQVSVNGIFYNDWKMVAVAKNHSCAIRELAESNNTISDRIFCWGKNISGQIGNQSLINVTTPTLIGGLLDNDWTAITVGSIHSCATKQNDSVYCWGSKNLNNLGLGVSSSASPIQVGTDTTWNKLQTGNNFVLAKNNTAEVPRSWVWGENTLGQLNFKSKFNKQSPTELIMLWGTVVAGANHACETEKYSTTTWTCWGDNRYLQVGRYAVVPGPPPALDPAPANPYSQVAVGGRHSCGIEQNKLWCWGDNRYGQIGIGKQTATALDVTQVLHPNDPITQWQSVSVGDGFTCAIDNSPEKKIYCWGSNRSNQLAISVIADNVFIPTPTLAEDSLNAQFTVNNTDWVKIKSGFNSSCAQKSTGELYCWGNNDYGKIQRCVVLVHAAASATSITPQAVSPDSYAYDCKTTSGFIPYDTYYNIYATMPTQLDIWTDFAIGFNHICAIKNDKTLWCTGNNAQGQLGKGDYFFNAEITQENSLATNWTKVVAGNSHTCAILGNVIVNTLSGTLWCWGDNTEGQLGTGNAWVDIPTLVPFL